MIKNETLGSFLRDLPFILAWDMVLWTYILLFAPRTVPILWQHRRLIGRAFDKRRAILARQAEAAVSVS